MPDDQPELDLERGVLPAEIFAEWNFSESRLAWASNYIAGLLVILFLAGVLPLSLLFLTSVLLVCLSTCIRAHVEHRVNRNLSNAQDLGSLTDVLQALSEAGSNRTISLTSFQLSLVQRDFNANDYDALLALDMEIAQSKRGQISKKHLRRLQTYKHTARPCCKCSSGVENDSVCIVCLDNFEEDAVITKLGCQHSFHADCIQPWLTQQGLSAQCPLCKAEVWPQSSLSLKTVPENEGPSLAIVVQ